MNKFCLLFTFFMTAITSGAQMHTSTPSQPYQATAERINDLVHTKLDARLDYARAQLHGKVWITLKPHFYATDSLRLDAKGMDIRQVSLVSGGKSTPLKYGYDGYSIDVDLNRSYKGGEPYTIYIDYTAKPNELKTKGSAAITDAKGLYFINPQGTDPNKPVQVWTQGETEATSVYVPTIDKPNQKTTQEFLLTVPAKYITLSNGKMISQKKNADGTRTDHWKMDQPHTPYLFFIGVGDFAVVKDTYKGKEVSYYVEKEYAPVARKIFGHTPEMMRFFSNITGIDYPWVKYSQMTARDYVSGAMENTTATLHSAAAQQDARELTDENHWENTIAHELFHQWFGDLVTTESWSNLTLNESFANYSEYLWQEYKYGKDAADAHHYDDMLGYVNSNSADKDLVRFHYTDKEDMFDAVSYNKGGRILHMLRNYVGDSAFNKAMNLYLTQNRYKSAEAHNLRLAFEEVTGKDLNWFFNQWYFGSGHPKLDINYSYDNAAKRAQVIVKQTQTGDKVFRLPVKVDVWQGGKRTRYAVWTQSKTDTFYFDSPVRPDLMNFDAEKVLLAQKTENKSLDEYAAQYRTGNYIDRREAIDAVIKKQDEAKGAEIMLAALNDRFHGLRTLAINSLDFRKPEIKSKAESVLATLAQKDPSRTTKAAAIDKLGDYESTTYASIFRSALNDSSYTVSGNALLALHRIDSAAAYREAKRLSAGKAKGTLIDAIALTMLQAGDDAAAPMILSNFENMSFGQAKFDALESIMLLLSRTESIDYFKKGVDAIVAFRAQTPENYKAQLYPAFEGILKQLQQMRAAAGQTEYAAYIESKLTAKGF